MAKEFIIVKELSTKLINGNNKTEEYNIDEIKSTLGKVKLIDRLIHLDSTGKVFLVLTFEDQTDRRRTVIRTG